MVSVRPEREPFFAEPSIRTCRRSVDVAEDAGAINVNVLIPVPPRLDDVANAVTTPHTALTRRSCALYPVTLLPAATTFTSTVYVPAGQLTTFAAPAVNAKLISSVVFGAMVSDRLPAAAVAIANW